MILAGSVEVGDSMNGFARKPCFSDQHVHSESVEAHLAFGKAMKFRPGQLADWPTRLPVNLKQENHYFGFFHPQEVISHTTTVPESVCLIPNRVEQAEKAYGQWKADISSASTKSVYSVRIGIGIERWAVGMAKR